MWSTRHGNVAPRLGIAYKLTQKGDLVLRSGAGIFYDLGVGESAQLASEFPKSAINIQNVSLPIGDLGPFILTPSNQPPYPFFVDGFSPNLKLPRSYQWNAALEKSFGGNQVLSVTYVGQTGRDLLRREILPSPNANFTGDLL